MKLLLDENVTHELRHFLLGHEAYTVGYLGWLGVRNGELIRKAAEQGFEALITLDKSIPKQSNLDRLPLALVVLRVPDNTVQSVLGLVPELLAALSTLTPRSVTYVPP